MSDRIKLCETNFFDALRVIAFGGQPTRLQRAHIEGTEFAELYRASEGIFDVRWRLTPAGEALLQAAELWDAMPEPEESMVVPGLEAVAIHYGLKHVAAGLEALRRNKEADNE